MSVTSVVKHTKYLGKFVINKSSRGPYNGGINLINVFKDKMQLS